MKKIFCQIQELCPLTDTVLQLILKPHEFIDYLAGQYLQIAINNEWLSYSIANAPLGAQHYECHIRHNPNLKLAFEALIKQGTAEIQLPFGNCHIEQIPKDKHLIFIAIGTGFAHSKAIIEQLLATGHANTLSLYWSARSNADLYLHEMLKQWQQKEPHFHYYPLHTQKEQLISLILANHEPTLSDSNLVLSGPFDKILSLRDALLSNNVRPQQLFSDAF